ncbi:MAG: ABC transporter ATP-binding protein [Bacilli bacterium]
MKKPQNFFKTSIRLLKYYKGSGFIFALVFILIAFSSFANIFGTYMLQYVINSIENIVKENISSNWTEFYKNLSIMLIVYGIGILACLTYTQTTVILAQKTIYKIRNDLIKHTEQLKISYFDAHKHGEIMTYFTNDVNTLYNALNNSIANVFFSFANIIGTILGMFLCNVYLALFSLIFIIISFVFIFLNSKKCQKYYRQTQKSLSNINAISEEDIDGIKVIKAFNHEESSFLKFNDANEDLRRVTTKSFYHTQLNVPFIVSLSYLNFAVMSIIGCLFLVNGLLSFSALCSFLVYVRQSAHPFNFFTMHMNTILTALSGAERIFDFLDTEIEPQDGKVKLVKINDNKNKYEDRYAWKIPLENNSYRTIKLRGDIRFKDVKFSYVENKVVLNGISFYAKPEEKIAFVGSTGAGKTTIISLLSRFYEIENGQITYDGIKIKDIQLSSLRRSISVVTQDTHLFTGTIKDNIRYGRRHSTGQEIIDAAKLTGADSFISRLPNGYETILYDDGKNLSEGQRQLIGLTRAAICKPPVLILDEATSNIDTLTEKLVQEAMDKLMYGRTVLVIAHRLSTVRNSDAILVLENGVIKERGSHEELLAQKGLYYSLYNGKTELE